MRLLGFPNHTQEAYTTISTSGAGSLEPALMGSAYLKTEEASELARLATCDPQHTQWTVSTNNIPLQIDGLALVNHNVPLGGQIRFLGSVNAPFINSPVKLSPTALLASSNTTGVVTSVDEDIYTPDANFMDPTTLTYAWSARFSFNTPTTPVTSSEYCCAVVRVKRVSSGSLVAYPVCWCELYQGGVLVRSLGWRAVTSTTGQIFIFPFTISEITVLADLEIRLVFNPGTTSQYARLESLAVYYESTAIALDSGWITITGDASRRPDIPNRHTHYFPATPWEDCVGYTVMIRSDNAMHDPLLAPYLISPDEWDMVPSGVIARAPDDFVQAGGFPAGQCISSGETLLRGMPLAGPETVAFEGTTAGGQSYGADSYGFRECEPVEMRLTRDEVVAIQREIGFHPKRPFYVAMEPGVASGYQMFTAFWAYVKGMSRARPLSVYTPDGDMVFTMEIQFSEKL